MVRNLVLQTQAAEPAIGQVHLHLLAQPTLRADRSAIADKKHPHHQLGTDRRTAQVAVVRLHLDPQPTQVQDGVDLTNKPSDGADDPVAYATAQYERSQLKDALHTLRVEQREVVVLAYFGGLTHSEIAKHLDQPLGTVKTRMRLGLRKMREALGPQVQESADHGL